MSLVTTFRICAVHGIPRQRTAPHRTAYHAALHCLRTAAEMIGLVCLRALSAYLIWFTANNLKAEFELRLIFVCGDANGHFFESD